MTAKRTTPWIRLCAGVLAGGALALPAFGLAAGIAEAAPTYRWCPGNQWDPGWGKVNDWDWGRCHDWQRAGGPFAPSGWGQWGPPPGWAPPQPPQPAWAPGANVMWNPTGGNWGIWNNGVWTPI